MVAADTAEDGPRWYLAPAYRLAVWALAAGLLDSLSVFARLRAAPQSILLDLITLLLFPVFIVVLTAIASGIFHIACGMLGGKAPWSASFRAMASMSWTAPLDVIALSFPPLAVVLLAYRLFLLSLAGQTLHGLSRAKSIAAAAMLGFAAFFLLLGLSTVIALMTL